MNWHFEEVCSLLAHVDKGVVSEVAVEVDVRLHPPEEVHIRQQRVVLEEAAEVAAHVVVGLAAPIQHPLRHLRFDQKSLNEWSCTMEVVALALQKLSIEVAAHCLQSGSCKRLLWGG